MAADRTAVVDPNQELPAWIDALAKGKEPLWTPLACGFLILVGWLGPRIFGLPEEVSLLCFAGAYLFGGITILQLHGQALGVGVPAQVMSMLPYVATIVVLVFISRDHNKIKLNAPACIGKPFHPTA